MSGNPHLGNRHTLHLPDYLNTFHAHNEMYYLHKDPISMISFVHLIYSVLLRSIFLSIFESFSSTNISTYLPLAFSVVWFQNAIYSSDGKFAFRTTMNLSCTSTLEKNKTKITIKIKLKVTVRLILDYILLSIALQK